MIIAVDIGATKTLVALASQQGKIIRQVRFLSTKKYPDFVKDLVQQIKALSNQPMSAVVIGCAGMIDRRYGIIMNSPNLKWLNKPLGHDIFKALGNVKVVLENDANLAGLAEAHLLDNVKQKVMYVTFSTGIGTGYIENGVLVPELLDSEGGHMVFEHKGQIVDWESFAAGKAIVKKYGKMASELDSRSAWKSITKNMALGIVNNCAVFPADTIIIGGGVGTYFKKYARPLRKAVKRLITKSIMLKIPKIVGAKNPEEAVILGCIILAQQHEQHR